MKYTTFSAEGYSGGSIIQSKQNIFYAKITVDLHEKRTLKQAALEQIYIDALISGAGKYSRQEFLDAIKLLGASMNISIKNSYLTITIQAQQENLPKFLTLFEIMIREPRFDPLELRRIKKQVKNEYIEHKEDAVLLTVEHFKNALFKSTDRRYSYSPDKIITKLQSIHSSDLRKLHKKMTGSHWTITLAANQKACDNMLQTVNKCKKQDEYEIIKRKHGIKPIKKQTLLHHMPSKQNIEFAIGAPVALTLNDEEYLPFVFGLDVLGKCGSFSGRLMSTVREKEGLTYGIYALLETVGKNENGYYRITTFFMPEKAKQGLQATLKEVRKIHKEGITEDEHKHFQNILLTQQILLNDSLIRSANIFHSYLCNGFTVEQMEAHKKRLLQVSKKEVNQTLEKYLQPNMLTISGAGPIKEVKDEIQSL